MKKKLALVLALMVLAPSCARTAPLTPPPEVRSFSARVIRVIDGDTLIFSYLGKEERVRLIGIDCPETEKEGRSGDQYSREAKMYTEKMVLKRTIRLEPDISERDRYGRILAYIRLENGTLLNSKLLEEGLAVIMTVPPDVKMAVKFASIQEQARQNRKGIWSRQPFCFEEK